jgi:hypothetical protein
MRKRKKRGKKRLSKMWPEVLEKYSKSELDARVKILTAR